jgi:N-methylhydantoinase B
MTDRMNPVTVGVIGNRLVSIVNEQQSALVNTAFSSVVRESLDLACAVFDSGGEMICQSVGGTPGHINAMATGMHHFVSAFAPSNLHPGDVLITNDPWMTAGQINDLNVATPVFRDGHIVAWFATCCHAPDIGGRIVSAAANDVFEEGLRLPIVKLIKAGVVNDELMQIIRVNVRTPDETVGDIYAQVSANEVGARSLLRLMDEFGLDSIDLVAEEIMLRSERALRDSLAAMDDGTYSAEVQTDGYGDEALVLKATITVKGEDIFVDYAGTSPQSGYGINVVLNYTRAYTSFAVKAAISPEVPHNAGSFRPVHVTAPAGSVLNCTDPAPVAARHLVGHFLPSLLFRALRPVMPNRLIADSCDAVWMTIWRGFDLGQHPFMFTVFQSGGMGARAVKDGLSATGFPSGVRGVPTEIIESGSPLVQLRKELKPNSGGAGRFRGGLGQFTEMSCRTGLDWTVNGNVDRTQFAAQGALGGGPGAAGVFAMRGAGDLPRKQLVHLAPGDVACVDPPGSGGYGDPFARMVNSVLADVVDGYVTLDSAACDYGVVIEYLGRSDAIVRPPSAYRVDAERTAALRSAGRVLS